MDGESEVPHPELARTGGGQGIQPPVSGLRKERWDEKGGHGWGWFSAGMVLRGKCRKNCLPRVSQTRLWGQQPFRPSLVGILGSLLVTGRLTVLPCSKLPQVRLRSLGWRTGRTEVWLPWPHLHRKPIPYGLFTTVHLKLEAPR